MSFAEKQQLRTEEIEAIGKAWSRGRETRDRD